MTKIKKGLLLSLLMKFFFKSVKIWQSYKQERGCLEHFHCLLAEWWPSIQSAQDKHLLSCNSAKYSRFTD